ncbi:MAG: ATP-binding protein [Bdellovibrionota bacterium]
MRKIFGFNFGFGQRIGIGFTITILLGISVGLASLLALRSVIHIKDRVALQNSQDLIEVEKLKTAIHQESGAIRGYLITRDGTYLADLKVAKDQAQATLENLIKRERDPKSVSLLSQIFEKRKAHEHLFQDLVKSRSTKNQASLRKVYEEKLMPEFDDLDQALSRFTDGKEILLAQNLQLSIESADSAIRMIIFIASAALILAIAIAFLLTRTLNRMHRNLEKAVVARDDLLAMVSHDLKNPLSAIMMSVSFIQKHLPDTERSKLIKSSVETIGRASERMHRLISDLLDLARIEANAIPLELKPQDPRTLVGEALDLLKNHAMQKLVRIKLDYDNDSAPLICDRERVLQVLSNLIGNAIKFSPEGQFITIRIQSNPREVIFSIADQGPGISGGQASQVFKRYWQSKSTTAHQGHGLGLFIANAMVVAHGGRIWFESGPGRGSTFSFTIPRSVRKTVSGKTLRQNQSLT